MRASLTVFLLGGLLAGLLTLAACDSLLVVGYVATNDSDSTTESDSDSSDDGLRNVKGSAADPWEVDTLAELQSIAVGFQNEELAEPLSLEDSLAGHYVLTANIDASPTGSGTWQLDDKGDDIPENDEHGFLPIGNCGADGVCVTDFVADNGKESGDDRPFAGSFDGAGFTVRGLHIVRSSGGGFGLFGHSTGYVRNLTLQEGNLSGSNYVGGLVGFNYRGKIEGSSTNVVVSCSEDRCEAGGLAGYNRYGTVENGSASGEVSCSSRYCNAGGLVGILLEGIVRDSSTSGTVNGDATAGGLVGWNLGGTVWNSHSSATVNGDSDIGGLVGWNDEGTVRDSSASGTVSGNDDIGGLVGYNDKGTIENNFASGDVSCSGLGCNASGLVGYNNGTLRGSYASGEVSCSGLGCDASGLVGYNNGTIQNSFATGDVSSVSGASGTVTAISTAGGLVGENSSGTIRNSFATGTVSCSGEKCDAGGLIGFNSSTVRDSYALGPVSCTGEDCNSGGLISDSYRGARRAYCVGAEGCLGGNDAEEPTVSSVDLATLRGLACSENTVFRWDHDNDDPDGDGLLADPNTDGDDDPSTDPPGAATDPQDCATAGAANFPWNFGTSGELPVLSGMVGGLDPAGQRALVDAVLAEE